MWRIERRVHSRVWEKWRSRYYAYKDARQEEREAPDKTFEKVIAKDRHWLSFAITEAVALIGGLVLLLFVLFCLFALVGILTELAYLDFTPGQNLTAPECLRMQPLC